MTDTTATERKYPVGQHPDLPPPAGTIGVVGWIRHNLFPSVMSSTLTIAAFIWLYFILPPILNSPLTYWRYSQQEQGSPKLAFIPNTTVTFFVPSPLVVVVHAV